MKNLLKELRQLHSLSQADLARELNISRQAINGFESGKFDPSLDMAFKIANRFNVPIQDVFIHEEKQPMPTIIERITSFFGLNIGFERFTDSAINAMKFANDRAIELHDSQIEPEYLLVGLFTDPTTISARLLRSSGMRLEILTSDRTGEDRSHLKLSPKLNFTIEMALQIVRLQQKKSIGTEHLLWGLVRLAETGNSNAIDLFERYSIDLDTLNKQLLEAV
jgi:putative transcriptional regulator